MLSSGPLPLGQYPLPHPQLPPQPPPNAPPPPPPNDVPPRDPALVGQPIVREQPLLPPGYESEGEKQVQVLRDIGLGEARPLDQVGDGGLPAAEALARQQAGGR